MQYLVSLISLQLWLQTEINSISSSFDTAIHPVLTLCGHLFW